MQALHFPEELNAVISRHTVSPRSPLKKLNPVLDNQKVLRVGGRLEHTLLTQDERYPMIHHIQNLQNYL